MSLLEKAMATKTGSMPVSDEHVELSVAWFRGEITTAQAAHALGRFQKGSNHHSIIVYMLSRALRDACQKGKISIETKL